MRAQVGHETARVEDFQNVVRDWRSLDFVAVERAMYQDARPHIDLEGTTFRYPAGIAFNRIEAVVHCVAKVGPRKTLSEHDPDPGADHRRRGDLHRRAAAEILTRNEDVASTHGGREFGCDGLEQIVLQDGRIERFPLASRRDDVVGIDVVAKAPRSTFDG